MARPGRGAAPYVRSEPARQCDEQGRQPVRAATEDHHADEFPMTGDHHESQPSWPPRNLAGLTVLVVDDDDGSLEYFAMALTMAGAVVTTASTAIDALRALQEQRAEVVLSDIAMPGHDGYWLVREIRAAADPAVRGVPVVATTAYGRVHSRDAALAAGFVDHLPKPVEPDLLCLTIARVAGRPG